MNNGFALKFGKCLFGLLLAGYEMYNLIKEGKGNAPKPSPEN